MAYTVNLAMHLDIGGVPLSTPAWEQTNLYALLGQGTVRGEDVVMPGAVGRRAVRRRTDSMNATIDLAFYGDIDWEGTAQTDTRMGLIRNLNQFKTAVVDPLVTADSVRPAVIHLPVGTLSAGVQVLGFEIQDVYNAAALSASMDITIMEGAFR